MSERKTRRSALQVVSDLVNRNIVAYEAAKSAAAKNRIIQDLVVYLVIADKMAWISLERKIRKMTEEDDRQCQG